MKNQRDRLSLNLNFGVVWLFVLVLAGFLAGCSSTPKRVEMAQQTVKEAYEIHKPLEVRTSKNDNRPDWTKMTVFENDGHVYFTGGFMNGSDYSVTIRCANAEALKVAVQSVSQFIRAEFSEYVQGSNIGTGGVDRYIEDGIATFVDNLHFQGIRQKELYYEELFSPSMMLPTYNVFVLLELSKIDYLNAKAAAVRKLHNKFSRAGELEAKEKAKKLLEKLKEETRRGV